MESRLAKESRISAGLLGAVVTGGIVFRAPVYVSFSLVVIEAVSWCVWIERNPAA